MRVISGGQTGVDRAALDAAIDVGLDFGGALPKGRKTEDGPLDKAKYFSMEELDQSAYSVRTEHNVVNSDATVIIFSGNMSGGTQLTYEMCRKNNKPSLCIDIGIATPLKIVEWIKKGSYKIVNFAGPRESQSQGIYASAYSLLFGVFTEL